MNVKVNSDTSSAVAGKIEQQQQPIRDSILSPPNQAGRITRDAPPPVAPVHRSLTPNQALRQREALDISQISMLPQNHLMLNVARLYIDHHESITASDNAEAIAGLGELEGQLRRTQHLSELLVFTAQPTESET